MYKLKQKNPKIKIERLNGKKPIRNLFRIPAKGFVKLDDPDYILDDL